MKYYANCPVCAHKLIKGENGTQADIRCARCKNLVHIQKGWTENKLCDMAGVSHSMFHSWVSRGTMPKLDTLESLCYALDKPLAALLFDVDENKLTGEEIQLLSRWKQLDIRQKKVIMDTIEAFGKTE